VNAQTALCRCCLHFLPSDRGMSAAVRFAEPRAAALALIADSAGRYIFSGVSRGWREGTQAANETLSTATYQIKHRCCGGDGCYVTPYLGIAFTALRTAIFSFWCNN